MTRTLIIVTCILAVLVGLRIGHYATRQRTYNQDYQRLANTFAVWDTEPVRRHLFLSFQDPDSFKERRAYEHVATTWLLLLYMVLKPLRWLGYSYVSAQRLLVLLHFAMLAWLLATRVGRAERPRAWTDPVQILWAASMAFGAAAAAASSVFWMSAAVGNPETWYYVPVIAFCYAASVDFDGRGLTRTSLIVFVIAAVIAPVYTPIIVAGVIVLWSTDSGTALEPVRRRLAWTRRPIAVAAVGIASLLLPFLLLHLGGFKAEGTPFLVRAGLNGDTRYFTSIVQAVVSPAPPVLRKWHVLPFPAVALLCVGAAALVSRPLAGRMLRQLFISTLPFLYFVIVFPQAVSIHPYLFDFGFVFAASFCLCSWLFEPEVEQLASRSRPMALAVVIVSAALLMTDFLDLSRL
jgi:hypothetical protein